MAEKIKYSKKDLKSPDEFVSTFARAITWIKENRTRIGFGAAIVGLVLAGVIGTQTYYRWKENKATRDLWPHLNRAREFLQTPGQADAEKIARLEQFLFAYVQTNPDTGATVYARYYLGSIASLRGNYDLALTQYRSALKSGKEKGVMRFLLRQGLAQALEAKGDFAAAAEAYRAVQAESTHDLKVLAMTGEARTLEFQGRKKEAADVYRKILADNPETPMKDFIEIKLRLLG